MGKASRSEEVSTVARTVEAVLGDTEALARRAKVMEDDPRSQAEVDAELASFDVIVEWLLALSATPSEPPPLEDAVQTELSLDAPPALPEDADDDFGTAAGFEATEPAVTVDVTRRDAKTPRKAARSGPDDQRTSITRLYEDVRWLFAINDVEAALVSLERMLVIASPDGEAGVFLERNDGKLLDLYESYIGPFDKTPQGREADEDTVSSAQALSHDRLAAIMALVDGDRSIEGVIEASSLSPLETCAALKQLERTGQISL